tara:strand:- start:25522 stop:25716 length:195 start_codon:yes stop_codon:yes gene_type:complete
MREQRRLFYPIPPHLCEIDNEAEVVAKRAERTKFDEDSVWSDYSDFITPSVADEHNDDGSNTII